MAAWQALTYFEEGKAKNHFLSSVLDQKKLFVMKNENELRRWG